MKENYSDKCEQILNELTEKKRLLLHSCCGPCSSYVITYLTNFFDITILYYNPNISPYEEYTKRKMEQIKIIEILNKNSKNNVDIMDCDYDNNIYEELSKPTIVTLNWEPWDEWQVIAYANSRPS